MFVRVVGDEDFVLVPVLALSELVPHGGPQHAVDHAGENVVHKCHVN